MKYYSLNKIAPHVTFKEATIRGLAPDKGLYFPETIPVFEKKIINNINDFSNEEIAFAVIQPYIGEEIPKKELLKIVSETINFEIPLKKIKENISSLELYHGPTLAFKDIGARFMSRCLGYFMRENKKSVTVLVATSGDTGGAVANGFLNVEGVNVVILYPSGKVSGVQEKQLTTLGNNIHAIEVDGTFDDCQQMVKQAFSDESLNKKLNLTSANSINVARWLPQQFYYLFAWKQWQEKAKPPIICVPSGNFGNICAGILAYISGLPVKHFIAACNANKVIPDFLETENFVPQKAIPTISNAMDVGSPSNFVRILELFDHRFTNLKNVLTSYSVSDVETAEAIKDVYRDDKYLLDPHGAVAFVALNKYLKQSDAGYFIETAHPVKFLDVVEPLIEDEIAVPESLIEILHKQKLSDKMKPDYSELKEYLLNNKKFE